MSSAYIIIPVDPKVEGKKSSGSGNTTQHSSSHG